MSEVDQVVYRLRTELYDRLYHAKSYAREAAAVRGMLLAAGIGDGSRVVEAACGTGNYLAPLSEHYEVAGFDLNEAMLEVARGKLPGVSLWQADMADFRVDPPADALLCLFSSIGYLHPDRLPAAAACFARALRPGGVALIEPWITPDQAKHGHMPMQTYDGTEQTPPEPLKLVRTAAVRVVGRLTVLPFHWLVMQPTGVEHLEDRHELWMSTREELCGVFEGAGFDATWIQPGPLTGRSLIFARRR